MTQATIKNISHEAFKSKSHGIFLCQHTLRTNTKSPILELLYILLYLYIYAQFALSFALQSTFFMEVGKL